MKQFDERDTVFSRRALKPGTKTYEEYYKKHPEKEEIDKELRNMLYIGTEGTSTYNPLNSPIARSTFNFLGDIANLCEGKVSEKKVDIEPDIMTNKIKKLTKYFGANLVGITEMKEHHYYSYYADYHGVTNNKIENTHKYGIVFAVEMKKEMIDLAPQFEEQLEVVNRYVDVSIIGMIMSYYIRSLGYDARNQMDGNYQVVAPLVAEDGGIGEIGRIGILVTKEFGPRVRLGIVTTDMPLIPNKKEEFGVKELCKECGRCAIDCIGDSISKKKIQEIDGDLRWKIDAEKCIKVWGQVGTDCGICLSSCPLSQSIPPELLTNIKDSREARLKIIKEYQATHGISAFLNNPIDVLD